MIANRITYWDGPHIDRRHYFGAGGAFQIITRRGETPMYRWRGRGWQAITRHKAAEIFKAVRAAHLNRQPRG